MEHGEGSVLTLHSLSTLQFVGQNTVFLCPSYKHLNKN